MTRKTGFLFALSMTIAAVLSPAAESQQQGGEPRNAGLRVYLECATRGCDRDHIRTEINFVSWMVDVADSQVHLIITSEETGSGQQFRLDFIGRDGMVGNDEQLSYASSNTDTDDERIKGLTGVIGVGLARYSVMDGIGGLFTVVHSGASAQDYSDMPPGLQGEVEDPWNYWVFGLGGNVEFDSEESERSQSYGGNFSANRTTETWKISLGGRGSLSQQEYDLTEDSTYVDKRDDWNVDGRVYYSLAERWSVGFESGASSSTRNNSKLGAQIGTGIEYSFFPYRDWTRTRMTLQAQVAARYADYDFVTIYGKDSETLWESSLRWSLGFRQPWGTANFNATAEAFLHDPSTFYRLSSGGRLSIRIMRGLNWNIDGNISRVRDQIYLSAEELSYEEVLLKRRQLPTDYTFDVSTGFSFTFGSIFNNVVNNRFGGGDGGGGHY